MDKKVRIIARFVAKPDKIDELRQLLHGMLAPTHAEPGCEMYDLWEDSENHVFYFDELWTNMELLQAHANSAHLKNLMAVSAPLITVPPAVSFLKPVAK